MRVSIISGHEMQMAERGRNLLSIFDDFRDACWRKVLALVATFKRSF